MGLPADGAWSRLPPATSPLTELTGERRALPEQLATLAETFGDSDPWLAQTLRNRAGWWRDFAGNRDAAD